MCIYIYMYIYVYICIYMYIYVYIYIYMGGGRERLYKEFMIWATVSSQSCFCWQYRASPSSAAKNIINLILVLPIWWYPCVESSLVLLEEGVWHDQCILDKTLLFFALLHFGLQSQTCLLLQVFLDFLLLHSSPLWWKDISFGIRSPTPS